MMLPTGVIIIDDQTKAWRSPSETRKEAYKEMLRGLTRDEFIALHTVVYEADPVPPKR